MLIDVADLPALARGCAVFGGGGGGDPALGELMGWVALSQAGPVPLVPLAELPEDGIVLPVAMIGAPTVGIEKLPRGDEGVRLKELNEDHLGRPVVAFISGELGGINGVAPVAWAARAGIPLVDGDLIGRAFPGVHYTIPRLRGYDPNPIIQIDERGNAVTFDVISPEWAHRYTSSTMVASGALMALSLYPMTVPQAQQAIVHDSMSRAINAGRLLAESSDDPVRALANELAGVALIEGKVTDIDRRTEEGFAKGSAVIEGTGDCNGQIMRLEFQNENLIALINGEPVATTPDVITVLDRHSGWPVVTEALRYGQRVAVLAFPCDPAWRTEEGLAVAGPGAFGYDLTHVPVEERHAVSR